MPTPAPGAPDLTTKAMRAFVPAAMSLTGVLRRSPKAPYGIAQHSYGSHRTINPTGVVPAGQEDPSTFRHPHNRDHLSATAA